MAPLINTIMSWEKFFFSTAGLEVYTFYLQHNSEKVSDYQDGYINVGYCFLLLTSSVDSSFFIYNLACLVYNFICFCGQYYCLFCLPHSTWIADNLKIAQWYFDCFKSIFLYIIKQLIIEGSIKFLIIILCPIFHIMD